MKKPEHYQLNQWELTDRVLMEDFNADEAKSDKVIAEVVATASNCKSITGTYTGKGKHGAGNPTSITFDGELLVVLPAEVTAVTV